MRCMPTAGQIYIEAASVELHELSIDNSSRVPPIRHNDAILMDMCIQNGGKDLFDKAKVG